MIKDFIKRSIGWNILRLKVSFILPFIILFIILISAVLYNTSYTVKDYFKNLDFNSYKIVDDAIGKNNRKKVFENGECYKYNLTKGAELPLSIFSKCIKYAKVLSGYDYTYTDAYGASNKLFIPRTKDKELIIKIINVEAIEIYKNNLGRYTADVLLEKRTGLELATKVNKNIKFKENINLKPGILKLEDYKNVQVQIEYEISGDEQKNYLLLVQKVGQNLVDNLSSEFDYAIVLSTRNFKSNYKDWNINKRYKYENVSDDKLYDIVSYKYTHYSK